MKSNLYTVERALYPRYAEGYIEEYPIRLDDSKPVFCPECGKCVSRVEWAKPRNIQLTKKNLPDFLYHDGEHTLPAISKRALDVIQQSNLTGILSAEKLDAVQFQREAYRSLPVPDYYFIRIAWSRMTVDHLNSGITYGPLRSNKCALCNPYPATYNIIDHFAFNTMEYEGYDIFHTYELCGVVFLSQRFIDVCKKEKLTGLDYREAEFKCVMGATNFTL